MGSKTSGRPGGNPDLWKIRQTDNPKLFKMNVAFDQRTHDFLIELEGEKTEFIRWAVSKAMREIESAL
jgi:hypothetical protein